MIGQWVARWDETGDSIRMTKWHLVESEIADRKITHCGRQLGRRDGTELAWTDAPAEGDRCRRCHR